MAQNKVGSKFKDERLDIFLSGLLKKTSRSYVKFLINDGRVTVNGKKEKPAYKVCDGDIVSYNLPEKTDIIETDINVPVIYKDRYCIVFNKPAGLIIHPGDSKKPRTEPTLTDVIARDFPGLLSLDRKRPGIVHRLDKDTSGVILVAKTQEALEWFRGQFKARLVNKGYEALVEGRMSDKEGIIEAPIARGIKEREKFSISSKDRGKEAFTEYRVIREYKKGYHKLSLLEVSPKTGRTHQIRVHLSSIGHPVTGDKLYSSRNNDLGIGRHFLHAKFLEIKTPDKEKHKFKIKLPEELSSFLDSLER